MIVRTRVVVVGTLLVTICSILLTIGAVQVAGVLQPDGLWFQSPPNGDALHVVAKEGAPPPLIQQQQQTTSSKDESFSACLLVMDENFRLHEWLAYHYHVLPLRYLVVAVDPRSKQWPTPIFQQFTSELEDLTIVTWNDTDFIPDWKPLRHNAKPKKKRDRHLARQRQFLASCLQHLVDRNKTWAALWDTDEYIILHSAASNKNKGAATTSSSVAQQPGSILRTLQESGETKCSPMARVLVGNMETPGLAVANNQSSSSHPPLDPRRFDTLRFRHRGRLGDKIHGFGKVVLNVAQITQFPIAVPNPHRPSYELCPMPRGDYLDTAPFVLHHYLGTWEAYSYRDDSRRGQEKSYEAYQKRADQSFEYVDTATSWMSGFLEHVGWDRGMRLLEHAGLDPDYNASHKAQDWKCFKNCDG